MLLLRRHKETISVDEINFTISHMKLQHLLLVSLYHRCYAHNLPFSYLLLSSYLCLHIYIYISVSDIASIRLVSPLHTDEGRRCARKLCAITCVNKFALKDITL